MQRTHSSTLITIAENQFGLFAVRQAIASGVPRAVVQRACGAGQLRRVHAGVYALAGHPRSKWEPHLAAGLIIGEAGALSHESAAAVYSLPVEPRHVEVTVTSGLGCRSLPAVVVHRSRHLPVGDVVIKRGVRVTSPARTFIDLVPRWTVPFAEKVLDEGLINRLWSVTEISDCLNRLPKNFRGRAAVRDMVALRMESPAADSALEARAFAVLARVDGFGPMAVHHQVVVDGSVYVLDAAWPDLRVAVEVAGRAHRVASRTSFDKERRKFNALAAAGWQVAHITAVMSDSEVTDHVRRLLVRALRHM